MYFSVGLDFLKDHALCYTDSFRVSNEVDISGPIDIPIFAEIDLATASRLEVSKCINRIVAED
jgi:hypothetical protein